MLKTLSQNSINYVIVNFSLVAGREKIQHERCTTQTLLRPARLRMASHNENPQKIRRSCGPRAFKILRGKLRRSFPIFPTILIRFPLLTVQTDVTGSVRLSSKNRRRCGADGLGRRRQKRTFKVFAHRNRKLLGLVAVRNTHGHY